jgi:predicted SprT family Zn-dependent metalloprotease
MTSQASEASQATSASEATAAATAAATSATGATAATRMALARAKLVEHGLSNWTAKTDNARARAGCCDHTNRTISFSKHYLRHAATTDAEFLNSVLHEIAHAKAGHAAGHGPEWLAIASSIGCDGKRCLPREVAVRTKVVACECGACTFKRHTVSKRLLRRVCSTCGKQLKRVIA